MAPDLKAEHWMGFSDRSMMMDSDMIGKVLGTIAGLTIILPATKSFILKVSSQNYLKSDNTIL